MQMNREEAWKQAVDHARVMAEQFAQVLGTSGRKVTGHVGQSGFTWVWDGTVDDHPCRVKFTTCRHDGFTDYKATGMYSVAVDVGYGVKQQAFNYKRTSRVDYDKMVARLLEKRDDAARILAARRADHARGLETAKRVGRLEEEYRTDQLPIEPRISGGDDGKFSILFRGLTEQEARTILDLVSQVPRRRTA